MGMFDFFEKDAGKDLLKDGNGAESIKKEIESSFDELPIDGLVVDVNDDTVVLAGVARDLPTKEKAVLIAGNVEGIAIVDADQLVTLDQINQENARQEPESTFYTIKEGDTLWAIAQSFYSDGNKYPIIVEANIEVIKDPELIYPGQAIRIPALA